MYLSEYPQRPERALDRWHWSYGWLLSHPVSVLGTELWPYARALLDFNLCTISPAPKLLFMHATCVYVCACSCMCRSIWKPEGSIGLILCLLRGRLPHWPGLTGHRVPGPVSTSPALGLQSLTITPGILCLFWGLDLGSQACQTSTSPAEPSSQPMTVISSNYSLRLFLPLFLVIIATLRFSKWCSKWLLSPAWAPLGFIAKPKWPAVACSFPGAVCVRSGKLPPELSPWLLCFISHSSLWPSS